MKTSFRLYNIPLYYYKIPLFTVYQCFHSMHLAISYPITLPYRCQLIAQLHKTETDLSSTTENKNHYLANQHMYEKEVELLKTQLLEEGSTRRAAEERAAHVTKELELVRKQKVADLAPTGTH